MHYFYGTAMKPSEPRGALTVNPAIPLNLSDCFQLR